MDLVVDPSVLSAAPVPAVPPVSASGGHARPLALGTSVACAAEPPTPAVAPTATTSSTPPPPPPPPPKISGPSPGSRAVRSPPRPALAVKIENSIASRPQTGLNAADIVWEEVVEGGITRYVAVFHSTLPPDIGPDPLRPARWTPRSRRRCAACSAFSGGQGPFVAAVDEAGLQVISHDAGAAGFYRHREPAAPTTSTPTRRPSWRRPTPPHRAAPPARSSDFSAPGGSPTAMTERGPHSRRCDLKLSGVQPSPRGPGSGAGPGRWLRAEGSRPAVEADGTPLRATNVVVLRVAIDNATGVHRPGRQPRSRDA